MTSGSTAAAVAFEAVVWAVFFEPAGRPGTALLDFGAVADIHLIRGSFRYAGHWDWDKISSKLMPVYTAATASAAEDRFWSSERAFRARGHQPSPCIACQTPV
ncbi:hypothetical protein ACFWJ5_09440 [Streptomyces qaidamensis]|uniref:hypothetical protein n=1 Tax=Streptomyces qaidamensis TaxID=1783515 RepID=UPI0036559781